VPAGGSTWHAQQLTLSDGLTTLPQAAQGTALRIRALIRPADGRVGVAVRASGDGASATSISYDDGQLVVDRTTSGDVAFSDEFASVSRARLPLRDGIIELDIWVDESSVEVFAADGSLAITEQIFPEPNQVGVCLVAEHAGAIVEELAVTVFAQ
jgi:sucrose-6-phosphate hydrolase SacC (GH32 family)